MTILDRVNYPDDIKNFDNNDLDELSDEIRTFLINRVSKTGGHLASNLGVVELTIAIHKVFNMPMDKVVWDVGHQTYVHKILTGRKEQFSTLRKYNGLSGFPKPRESKYDIFATGHSSTSISSALGIAKARDIKNEKYNVIAVIGDGALTGGLALEGLNEAGSANTNIIVILNDNEMSISQNVGSMASYLSKMRTDPAYLTLRDDIETLVKRIPGVGNNLYKSAEKLKESLKYLLVQGMLFEELGFTYLGPIDGHNIEKLSGVLRRAKNMKGPILIHVVTKKGKGYSFAEKNPDIFHGIGPFEIETGENISHGSKTYSQVFGDELVKRASTNKSIVAITAAMPDGTGLKEFSIKYPERFFDVGIAEQHAVTFAAGLAVNGMKPVFAVYSTFLQRAYDQILHDVCLQNLPVMIAIDRAGIVGEDGETHQGLLDLCYLRTMPNMTIIAPKDLEEFKKMIEWGLKYNYPLALRYPRGGDMNVDFKTCTDIEYGKWEPITDGTDCAILACGKMVQMSMLSCNKLLEKGIKPKLVNCRFIKPLDFNMLNKIFEDYSLIFSIEDNYSSGGFGSSILEYAAKSSYKGKIVVMGFPDEFIPQGSCNILYKKYELDIDGIYEKILKEI